MMDKKPQINQEGSLSVSLDLKVYSLNAIKKAAYKFTDKYSVIIELVDSDSKVQVLIKSISKKSDELENVAQLFCNEVIDQDLREIVAKETEGVKNLIIAQAFSKTSLINQELESKEVI